MVAGRNQKCGVLLTGLKREEKTNLNEIDEQLAAHHLVAVHVADPLHLWPARHFLADIRIYSEVKGRLKIVGNSVSAKSGGAVVTEE